MSVRRSRPSTGPVGPQVPAKASFSALDAFEDFRRRHSKQNKDIIVDNALRRTTIANLQDEVAKLHIEVLQLRETNIQLSNQVKQLQSHPGRSVDETTRAAIDQILAAIPALQHFRHKLDNTPSPVSEASLELDARRKAWMIESSENPTATRPAATGGEFMRLLTLEEATEYGSDASMSDADLKVIKVPQNRRMTEIASVAVPRSPRPIANRPSPSDYFIVTTPPPASTSPAGSPSSSRSPSPVRTAKSPSKDKKQKKRRESGFQLPQARERSITPPEVEQLSQIPDWEEGRSVIIAPLPKVAAPTPATLAPASAPTLARSKQAERTVLRTSAESSTKAKPTVVAASKARTVGGTAGIIVSGSKAGGHISNPAGWTEDSAVAAEQAVVPTATKAVLKPSREVTSVIRDRDEPATLPIITDDATLGSVPTSEAAFLASLADDEGGRVRRARKSVNYKEPNLTKKMRKPDGVAIEDTLRAPRLSTASSTSGQDIPTPLSAASSTSKRTLSHTSGPRRKSVLPRTAIVRSRLEDSDDDDPDGMDLRHELAKVDVGPGVAARRRAMSPEDGKVIVVDACPPSTFTAPSTSPPSAATTSTISSSASSEYSPYVPPSRSTQTQTAARTSPRKSQTKRPEGLGADRPSTATGATGRVASGSASRAALSDRPAENGQRSTSGSASGSLASSIGKAGTTVKRPAGGAARRASSVV